jgi:DNA-binding cell septation regulator SpoVG
MKISIEHIRDQFNVALSSKEGVEPFITIKGARIVEGKNGPFISWPAKKMDSGKYWNHVWCSEAFNAAVLEAAQKTAPKPAKAKDEAWQARQAPVEDDIPFIFSLNEFEIRPSKERRLARTEF